jgi:peptidoglycan hydrolase-like protein with peptidoglycan-binding domain/predicted chitinase
MRTVIDVIRDDRPTCSTAGVRGLSLQIIEEMNRIIPGGVLVRMDDLNITGDSASVNFFMQPRAKEALARGIARRGSNLVIHSCFRTVVQQHVLFSWQGSNCVSIAATPGRSNHEDGYAIDTPDFAAWRQALEAEGWDWFGPGDDVHFTYVGGGVRDDIGQIGLKAFQTLWNRHNPSDRIDVDGSYGEETAARLDRSPADGFPVNTGSLPPSPTPSIADTTTTAPSRILKLMSPPMRGDDVAAVQRLLAEEGLLDQASEAGQIDGVYGDATAQAVRTFQLHEGLAVDGQVGPNTLKALRDKAQPTPVTPIHLVQPSPAAGSIERVELQKGDGIIPWQHLRHEVEILQTSLRNWGVLPKDAPLDGQFGSATEAAVQSFQRLRPADPTRSRFVPSGLAITGVVDRNTWAELLKVPPEAIRMGSRDPVATLGMPNGFPEIGTLLDIARCPEAIRPFAEQNVPSILAQCLNDGVSNRKQIAYVLATAEHESHFGRFMIELASGDAYEGRTDLGNTHAGDGRRYKGRGYVQITGRINYSHWSQRLGIDLIGQPELASQANIAVQILVQGMRDGSFTGLKLADFIGNDFVSARKIINGLDRAQQIADIATAYAEAIKS